jgi:poly-gamma-glutamate synthesis protein (capsule biosynthesis protein)
MPSSNNPMKQFFFMSLAAIIGIGFASILSRGVSNYADLVSDLGGKVIKNQAQVAETIPVPEIPAPAEIFPEPAKEATLAFVGDIMLDRAVKNSVEKNFDGDYSKLFENMSELRQADIAFGNLEGPVSTGGKKAGSVFSFRFSPDSMPALEQAGFDVMNIANNHIGDWDATAFADTLDNLVSSGLKYIGGGWDKKEAATPVVIEKNGISIGFLGFSDVGPDWMAAKESSPGILLASDPNFDQMIINAAGKADVLVVSFHWGEEYKKYNSRQQELAHRAINDGADLVIGSHPHVIQETEEYGDGLIAYSLGNFIFDQKFSSETMEGLLLEATVTKDGLKDYSKKLFKLDDSYQPQASVDYASTQ